MASSTNLTDFTSLSVLYCCLFVSIAIKVSTNRLQLVAFGGGYSLLSTARDLHLAVDLNERRHLAESASVDCSWVHGVGVSLTPGIELGSLAHGPLLVLVHLVSRTSLSLVGPSEQEEIWTGLALATIHVMQVPKPVI